jgi:HK97 family phage portal protein
MAFWHKKEARSSLENPEIPISSPQIIQILGAFGPSAAGVNVTVENALGVPAVWAAVQFLSSTIASLPIHVYKKTDSGRERVNNELNAILHDAPNDEISSFDWRKYSMDRTLTGGRSISYIEKNGAGRILNIWPIDPALVTVKRKGGKKVYQVKGGTTYQASEILDIPFALKSDMLTAISPILANKDAIGLAIAATNYGSKFFQNGGVPPFVMTGNFQSGAALNRASNDLENAVKKASKENRLALSIPAGHEIKSIGADPEKSQLVELKRFQIEEIARIYSMPPVFLQDLTHGTFSNTEQQDLHLVKHLVTRWVLQHEQEMNLKFFGRGSDTYVEYNLDGLLRGDFKSRMEGYATGIQNGIIKPNEARRQENRPDDAAGDMLMIQGATVPIANQIKEGGPDEA